MLPVGRPPRFATSAPARNASGITRPMVIPPQRTMASCRHSFQTSALNMDGLRRSLSAEERDEDLLEGKGLDRDFARTERSKRLFELSVRRLGGHREDAAVGLDIDEARRRLRRVSLEYGARSPDARLERLQLAGKADPS